MSWFRGDFKKKGILKICSDLKIIPGRSKLEYNDYD
jgi:hypothetical protein